MNKTQFTRDFANKKLLAERLFNGPIEKVWRAWTEPELLDQWWAPKPWKTDTHSMDFRVGGRWLYVMNGPEGEFHNCMSQYEFINPMESFSGIDGFCDPDWNLNGDLAMQWQVKFEARGNSTLVNIITTFPTEEAMNTIIEMGVEEGSGMAYDNLDELLPTIE